MHSSAFVGQIPFRHPQPTASASKDSRESCPFIRLRSSHRRHKERAITRKLLERAREMVVRVPYTPSFPPSPLWTIVVISLPEWAPLGRFGHIIEMKRLWDDDLLSDQAVARHSVAFVSRLQLRPCLRGTCHTSLTDPWPLCLMCTNLCIAVQDDRARLYPRGGGPRSKWRGPHVDASRNRASPGISELCEVR